MEEGQLARRLLQDAPAPAPPPADCSCDTLLGSASVGASIFILLLIGFVAGFALSWLIWWRREKRRGRLEVEYRNRFGRDSEQPDVQQWIKAANTPTIKSPVAKLATAGNSGGAELAGAPPPTLQLPRGGGAAGGAPAPGPAASGPLALGVSESVRRDGTRGGSAAVAGSATGNPFADVESYNVLSNPMSSLNDTPRLPPGIKFSHSTELSQSTGLIGALRNPVSDPTSPQPNKDRADPTASDAAWGAQSIQSVQHARQATVVREQEYDMDDLDEEWRELLLELNGQLGIRGQPPLNRKETAVAIRSLITADVAISNTLADIQRYRRVLAPQA
eukprot:scaffold1.g5717.t1